jgi:hypothetical protein
MKQYPKCDLCDKPIRNEDQEHIMKADSGVLTIHKLCALRLMNAVWDEQQLRARYNVPMTQKGLLTGDPQYNSLALGIERWSDLFESLDTISDTTPEGFTLYKASPVPFASTGTGIANLNIEGWISTDKEDAEKDTVPPEAFGNASLTDFFARGAPMSRDHNTNTSAVGYLLKAVLVRNGRVLQEENNSLYERVPFLADYGYGNGFYARGIVDDADTADKIRKGKIRGFSFIGRGRNVETLPNGGRLIKAIDPLIEVTVGTWPINSEAYMRVVKGQTQWV